MIHAYEEESLDKAMDSLGEMMEYASLDVGIAPGEFYQWFLVSGYADRFGGGETAIIDGMSGIELARAVMLKIRRKEIEIPPVLHMDKGSEYWAAWALAYYQWHSSISFRRIEEAVPFMDVLAMYHPYHEMDISSFSDKMDERTKILFNTSPVKRLRRYAELTQRELSDASGVPIRTIQQYEQGQKDIHKAAGDTILRLSFALSCTVEDLMSIS